MNNPFCNSKLNAVMKKDMRMNEMRRNEAAMKNHCRYQKKSKPLLKLQ